MRLTGHFPMYLLFKPQITFEKSIATASVASRIMDDSVVYVYVPVRQDVHTSYCKLQTTEYSVHGQCVLVLFA